MESDVIVQKLEEYKANGLAAANIARFNELATRYRDDAALRARIDAGDVEDSLAFLGIDSAPGIEVRIVADEPGTIHFALPPDPNVELSDEMLASIAGGKTAGSAGSLASASTFLCSCSPSTLTTASSAGTVGSAS